MAGIFKAYDVRGLYPEELDETRARAIGRSFPQVLDPSDLERTRTVVVGRDMRPHGVPLCEALIEGLREGGVDVLDIGLATTPMNYFAVGRLGAAGGVQVTASHHPPRYNHQQKPNGETPDRDQKTNPAPPRHRRRAARRQRSSPLPLP